MSLNNNGGKEGSEKKAVKSNKVIGIVIIGLLVVLISVGAVLAYAILSDKNKASESGADRPRLEATNAINGRGIVATPENFEEVVEALNEQPNDDTRFTSNMSLKFAFDKWDEPSKTAFVKNDESNSRTICFEIYLRDEEGEQTDLIYTSPYIPVGARLDDFALDKEVPKGEYMCSFVYHLVDEDYNVVANTTFGVELIING